MHYPLSLVININSLEGVLPHPSPCFQDSQSNSHYIGKGDSTCLGCGVFFWGGVVCLSLFWFSNECSLCMCVCSLLLSLHHTPDHSTQNPTREANHNFSLHLLASTCSIPVKGPEAHPSFCHYNYITL